MTRLPPNPNAFSNAGDWQNALYEYLLTETRVAQDNDPLPVLLPHRIGDERAAVDGVLMFDPNVGELTYSLSGAWVTLADGASAYDIAVADGFVGDEAAWLASLVGADGDSAYAIAVANGFVGSEAAWLASLEAEFPAGAEEGQVLAWLSGAPAWQTDPEITVVKTANETVVSSNAYQNDDELVSPTLEANSYYHFELRLIFTAGTAEDMRFRIGRTGLSDAEFLVSSDLDNAGAATATFNGNLNCPGAGVASIRMGTFLGFLSTGTDTGTLVVQWAQQVAGVNVTTMRAGSMMRLRKVT